MRRDYLFGFIHPYYDGIPFVVATLAVIGLLLWNRMRKGT
jgi:hypothetical protein